MNFVRDVGQSSCHPVQFSPRFVELGCNGSLDDRTPQPH